MFRTCLLLLAVVIVLQPASTYAQRGRGGEDSGRGGGDFGGGGFGRGGFGGGGFGGGFGRGGEGGGGREFNPERMFGFFDRDQDGQLTGDELDRLPPPFRSALEDKGLGGAASITLEDFVEAAPRRGGDGDENGGDQGGRRGDRGSNGEDSRKPAAKEYFKPRTHERIIPLLSDKYKADDLDRDGQVDLYEWRTSRAGQLADFVRLDRDGDGFLTPWELQAADKAGFSVAAPPALAVVPPSQTATPGTQPAPSSTPSAPTTPSAATEALTKEAQRYFSILDKNQDKRVTEDEWSASRRLKPEFEGAGVKLSEPLSETDFVTTFVRIKTVGKQ